MKYWKNGFYDTPHNGAVEISEKYYQELLSGQSAGKMIVEDKKGFPILVEYEPTIEELRTQKIGELRVYDASDAVNQFSINGVSGWFNKSTRVGLMNSFSVEQASERDETSGHSLFMGISCRKIYSMASLHDAVFLPVRCHQRRHDFGILIG